MAFDLKKVTKGETFSLSKERKITRVRACLQWDPNPDVSKNTSNNAKAKAYDLDVIAFITGPDGKVKRYTDFVWFKDASTRTARKGAVQLSDDEQTGGKVGDDEWIIIDLENIGDDATSIFIGIAIYEAEERGQNFGQVPNAKIRLLDDIVYAPYFAAYSERNKEALALNVAPAEELDLSVGHLTGYDLQENFSTETVVLCSEIYREATGQSGSDDKPATNWNFRAIGRGISGGLGALVFDHFQVPNP